MEFTSQFVSVVARALNRTVVAAAMTDGLTLTTLVDNMPNAPIQPSAAADDDATTA